MQKVLVLVWRLLDTLLSTKQPADFKTLLSNLSRIQYPKMDSVHTKGSSHSSHHAASDMFGKNHPALWFQHWQAWPDRAQRKETVFTAGLAAGVLVVLHVAQRFYYTSGVVNPKVFSEHAFFEDSSTTYTFGVIFPCLRQLWKFNPGFSTSQERMDFIENLLGDNVQKHSEAWRLACWFAAIQRYT